MSLSDPHPMQPTGEDQRGTIRFKPNKIVNDMLSFATARGFGLNEIACRDYSVEDREQFAQLIGYSLSGYGELSYVRDDTYMKAEAMRTATDERDAELRALREVVARLRSGLRKPVAELFGIHPDDLKRE